MDKERIREGFLVSPLAAPVIFALLAAINAYNVPVDAFEYGLKPISVAVYSFAAVFIPGAIVSYLITFLLGFPIFYLLRRVHKESLVYWASLAGLTGMVVITVPVCMIGLDSAEAVMYVALFGLLSGICNGAVFWYVSVRKSPGRRLHGDAKSLP